MWIRVNTALATWSMFCKLEEQRESWPMSNESTRSEAGKVLLTGSEGGKEGTAVLVLD